MNSSILKLSLNSIKHHKATTILNLFGFSISLMFVILFGLYLQREYAVDNYHENKGRIFRLVYKEGSTWAVPSGADLQTRYPEIEATVQMQSDQIYLENERGEMLVENVLTVDTSFFRVFSYRFVEGSPRTALRTKQDVVLSESFAKKLFGTQPALGKIVKTDGSEFIVTGVVADVADSHLKNFGMITPIANLGDFKGWPEIVTTFSACGSDLYLLIKPHANLFSKLAEMEEYMRGNEGKYWMFASGRASGLELEPLTDVYFSTRTSTCCNHNDPTFLGTLGITILLILFFAVINYVNLSVAQTGFRAKEVSLRRLLGGSKSEFFTGFIVESFILCAVSLLLALLLGAVFQLRFQKMMNTDVSVISVFTPMNMLILMGGLTVLSIVAGLIPGISIASFKPIEVVRGTFRWKTKMVYSKFFIGFQYAITIILVGCTIVIVRQINFMTGGNIGFNRDFILVCEDFIPASERNTYRAQFLAIPGVEKVGFSRGGPIIGGENLSFTSTDNKNFSFTRYEGDTSFFSILGFEILRETKNAASGSTWMNETAWRKADLPENAIEFKGNDQFRIPLKGIIKDFHFTDFEKPISEVLISELPETSGTWCIWIKISSADPFGTLKRVEKTYNELEGGNLFNSQSAFLNDHIAKMYEKQKRLSGMMGWLSVLAIVISTLGMLAMSTYMIRQRTKEVAIRKVFGARNAEVLYLLLMNSLKLALVGFIIAIPVIWYLARGWLSNYAYRIPLSWTIFFMAGVAVVTVVTLTVVWQSAKAAYTNPIKSIQE